MRGFLFAAIGAMLVALVGGVVADDIVLPGMAVERYVPDSSAIGRTVYADKIVLYGPECIVTLDASRRAPGLRVYSRRTGETATVAIGTDGRCVVGVASPGRSHLVSALYASGGQGCIQLSDRGGRHAVNGAEFGSLFGPR